MDTRRGGTAGAVHASERFMSVCFFVFVLQVYSSVYFCGHVFFLVAFLIMPYLRKALVPKKEQSQKKEE